MAYVFVSVESLKFNFMRVKFVTNALDVCIVCMCHCSLGSGSILVQDDVDVWLFPCESASWLRKLMW